MLAESWGTVLAALVTGACGIVGIVITQVLAKKKVQQVRDEKTSILVGMEPSGQAYSNIMLGLHENRLHSSSLSMEIKSDLGTIKEVVGEIRQTQRGIEKGVDRIERELH